MGKHIILHLWATTGTHLVKLKKLRSLEDKKYRILSQVCVVGECLWKMHTLLNILLQKIKELGCLEFLMGMEVIFFKLGP